MFPHVMTQIIATDCNYTYLEHSITAILGAQKNPTDGGVNTHFGYNNSPISKNNPDCTSK